HNPTSVAPRRANTSASTTTSRSCFNMAPLAPPSLASLVRTASLAFLRVAAELRTHRRKHLVGELAESTRLEAFDQRRGDDRRRDAEAAGRGPRPAALTGVGDAPGEVAEIGRLRERVGGEADEPRADHRPAPPYLGDFRDVDLVLIRPRVAQRCGLGVDLL